MASKQYNLMKERANRLKKLFTPKKQNVSGVYKINTKEKTYSFSVLMHASIENYLELELKSIGDSAIEKWNLSQFTSIPLIAMMCRREGDEIGFSEDVYSISAAKRLSTVVNLNHKQFLGRISKNHGIRKENLAKLFMSVGFTPSGACQIIINSLDGFGAKRGEYAHTAPSSTLLRETDPFTEAAETMRLVDELEVLDEEISAFRIQCGL
jgi:hypothetical protein